MAEGNDADFTVDSSVIGCMFIGGKIRNAYIQNNVTGSPNPDLARQSKERKLKPGEITNSVVGAVFSGVDMANAKVQSNINQKPPSYDEEDEDLSWDIVTPDAQGLYSYVNASRCLPAPDPVIFNSETVYKMDSHPYKGAAFILNNNYFPGLKESERKGSDVDVQNAKLLWKRYGFYVKTAENKSAEEVMEELSDFLALDRVTRTDCVVVMLMSHGGDGVLHGNDSRSIKYSDIFRLFQPDNCPKLKDKPKIFFIQACRGEHTEVGTDANPYGGQTPPIQYHDMNAGDGSNPTPFENFLKTPLPADFYIAHSTCDGFYSMRDSVDGSYFIQALVEVFFARANQEDLKSLMTKVSYKVSRIAVPVTVNKKKVRMMQQPQTNSTLRKMVYFKES